MDDTEKNLRDGLEHMANTRAGVTQPHADDAGEYCDDQGLQDIAIGQRREEAHRNYIHHIVDDLHVMGLAHIACGDLRIQGGRIDVEPGAGVQQIGGGDADDESEGGDDFKIDQ